MKVQSSDGCAIQNNSIPSNICIPSNRKRKSLISAVTKEIFNRNCSYGFYRQ